MSASTVPAAIDALVALGKTVAANADPAKMPGKRAQAIDGPTKHVNAQTILAIAHPAGIDSPALTGQQTLTGLTVARDTESYAIGCKAEAWAGAVEGGGYKAPRDACFALLDAFVDAIAADQSLGGVVIRAHVVVLDYVPALTSKGPSVVLPFQVHVDARRSA